MKSQNYNIVRYDADEGMVFDWKDLEPHKDKDEDGNEVINHLYAKTLFIGGLDTIDNYVEVSEKEAE